MDTNPSRDPIEATTATEPVAITLPPGSPRPRPRRIWFLLGVLVVMSAAAVASNIIFYQPPIRMGYIGLKPGDPGPRDIGAMLGKAPNKGEHNGGGQRKGGQSERRIEDGIRNRIPDPPVEVDDPAADGKAAPEEVPQAEAKPAGTPVAPKA